jgi:hypothetical protein
MIRHKKKFGVYHWDTFDNHTTLVGECDSIQGADDIIQARYVSTGRLSPDGADRVEVVDKNGNVLKSCTVR